jgi:hypothetical protein
VAQTLLDKDIYTYVEYVSSAFAYCYQLVKVISLGQTQSDPINWTISVLHFVGLDQDQGGILRPGQDQGGILRPGQDQGGFRPGPKRTGN